MSFPDPSPIRETLAEPWTSSGEVGSEKAPYICEEATKTHCRVFFDGSSDLILIPKRYEAMTRHLHSGHYSDNLLTSYHCNYSFYSTAPQIHCLQGPRFLSLASLLALFFDDYAKSIGLDMVFKCKRSRGKTSS